MTIEKIYWWIMVVRMIFIIPKKFYGQVTIECDGNVSPMAFEDDKITIEPLDALVMTESYCSHPYYFILLKTLNLKI